MGSPLRSRHALKSLSPFCGLSGAPITVFDTRSAILRFAGPTFLPELASLFLASSRFRIMQGNRRVYHWRNDHEQLAIHIERPEWFLAKGIHTSALARKLDDLKDQARIMAELVSAEMRPAETWDPAA